MPTPPAWSRCSSTSARWRRRRSPSTRTPLAPWPPSSATSSRWSRPRRRTASCSGPSTSTSTRSSRTRMTTSCCRVQELGLAVVDVTHDGDHRRTRQQLVVILVRELRVEVDVEGPEQLAVLLLGRDHLDDVAELGGQGAEGLLVEGLRRRRHLAEVEEHRDQAGGVGIDLVGEVVQRRTVTQPDDRGAVAAGNLHTAERRCLHLLELLALRALGLAAADRLATGPAECALRAAAATTTTGAWTATEAT